MRDRERDLDLEFRFRSLDLLRRERSLDRLRALLLAPRSLLLERLRDLPVRELTGNKETNAEDSLERRRGCES